MAWFKKKEDGDEENDLPELPELPEIDSIMPQERKEKPSSSQLASMGEPVVKSLPASESSFKPSYLPQKAPPEVKRSIEMPKKMPDKNQIKAGKDIFKAEKEQPLPPSFKKNEPIFVRIDKFETALESIKNIKKKVDDMESLLTNLRQVNAKEDLELSEWEKEINAIKTKIDSIDANLFSKLG